VAFAATFTVAVITGKLAPPFTTEEFVQTLAGFGSPQVQPVPAMDTSVRPVGTVSVTVTPPDPEPLKAKLTL
jgi:hypothetical protein